MVNTDKLLKPTELYSNPITNFMAQASMMCCPPTPIPGSFPKPLALVDALTYHL